MSCRLLLLDVVRLMLIVTVKSNGSDLKQRLECIRGTPLLDNPTISDLLYVHTSQCQHPVCRFEITPITAMRAAHCKPRDHYIVLRDLTVHRNAQIWITSAKYADVICCGRDAVDTLIPRNVVTGQEIRQPLNSSSIDHLFEEAARK